MRIFLTFLAAGLVFAQSPHGVVERIQVRGKSLEKNLDGDSPDRDVSIYLPPSYQKDTGRRYPVVYFLHGFTDDENKWYGPAQHWIKMPVVLDKAFANAANHEMIFVTPNAFTRFAGSMYGSSIDTGDWETFLTQELVAYIDAHYRTIATPAARGLAGHSMGGYGAIRNIMKHPGIFSSVYLLSPCCMMPPAGSPPNADLNAIHTQADFEHASFMAKAMFASAAAWSPNPDKPPFFVDLPTQPGDSQALILGKWAANAPLAMIDQYVPNLRQLKAIAMDAGTKDEPIASTVRRLDQDLTRYKIDHTFEIYEGDHLNHIADRIEQKLVPFFTKHLADQK